MSFNLDSKTNEYVLKLATPQDKFPFIVGFYEDPSHIFLPILTKS